MKSPTLPTSAPEPGSPPPRSLLLALALLTMVAMVVKAAGLSAPMPRSSAPTNVPLAGHRVSPLGSEPPRQGRELSRGQLRRFRLLPVSGEPVLRLTLLPVRTRTATDLSAETMGGKGLSLDTVRAVVPGFALKEPRVISLPMAEGSGPAATADQVALGRGPADPDGSITRLQTCLTPSGIAAVKATTLASEASVPSRPGDPPARWRRLLRLLGQAQPRHECLAVQLESEAPAGRVRRAGGGDHQRQLEAGWRSLRGLIHAGKKEADGGHRTF